ncbi:MAG: photosystem I assembly protein Ycf3 [Methanoregula sp. PtaU1.Bin051]|nr:MAG: photosystem I assembly protein Ycf3 [Methanoregula sp. PtaU1.Bin051]
MTGAGNENNSEKKKRAEELFEKGKQLENDERYEEAVNLFDEALNLDHENDAIWSEKADALVLLGIIYTTDPRFFKEACHSIEKALRINKNNAKALNNKGYILHRRNQNAEGLQFIEQAIQADPTYADAWDNKANALSALGEIDKALEAYDQAIKADPDYPSPYCNKGVLFTRIDRDKESLEWFDKALQKKPGYANALLWKGVALSNLGEYEKALELLSKYHTMRPQNKDGLIYLGFTTADLHRYAEANEYFNSVLKIDPKNVSARWGKVYTEKSRKLEYEYQEKLNKFQVNLIGAGQTLIDDSIKRLGEFYGEFDTGFKYALIKFVIQFILGIGIFFGGIVLYTTGTTALLSAIVSTTGGVTFIHSLIRSSPYAIMKNRTDFSQWMIAYTYWIHTLIDANKQVAQQSCTGAGDWEKIKNVHKDLWNLSKNTIYIIEECCESNKPLDLKKLKMAEGVTEPQEKK